MRGVPRERRAIIAAPSGSSVDAEQIRGSIGDGDQVVGVVEVEPERDPEAIAQRRAERARPRGCADDREAVEREAQRLSARSLAGDEVEREVLHRRVERLLHRAVEAVHLVDEEHVAFVEAGEDRREHALVLERRTAGEPHVDAHLDGDDLRERGLAEAGWSVQQHVVERVAALFARPRRGCAPGP